MLKKNKVKILSSIIMIALILSLSSNDAMAKLTYKAAWLNNPTKQKNLSLVLFYSEHCPHCRNVHEYIEKKHLIDKIRIAQKEVLCSKANQIELSCLIKKCKMDTNAIGLPLLWTGKRCLIGDKEIIKYLSEVTL